MSKEVRFETLASAYVEVTVEEIAAYLSRYEKDEVSEEDAILEVAWEKFARPRPCAQCSGWGQPEGIGAGFELGDEWDAGDVNDV